MLASVMPPDSWICELQAPVLKLVVTAPAPRPVLLVTLIMPPSVAAPAFNVTPPVKVLLPPRTRRPAPVLVMPKAPVTGPDIVRMLPLIVNVRAAVSAVVRFAPRSRAAVPPKVRLLFSVYVPVVVNATAVPERLSIQPAPVWVRLPTPRAFGLSRDRPPPLVISVPPVKVLLPAKRKKLVVPFTDNLPGPATTPRRPKLLELESAETTSPVAKPTVKAPDQVCVPPPRLLMVEPLRSVTGARMLRLPYEPTWAPDWTVTPRPPEESKSSRSMRPAAILK